MDVDVSVCIGGRECSLKLFFERRNVEEDRTEELGEGTGRGRRKGKVEGVQREMMHRRVCIV